MQAVDRCDARDLSKSGFLAVLRRSGLLRDLKVFPMLTGVPFAENEWAAYVDMLGISSSDLLNLKPFSHSADYFAPAQQFPGSDIFADAGNGIADEDQQRSREHITIGEIERLLPATSSRILIVFQSRPNHNFAKAANVQCLPGETFRTAIRAKLEGLAGAGMSCFAFHDATLNFIVVGRERGRVDGILRYLREVVGVPAKRLICPEQQAGAKEAA